LLRGDVDDECVVRTGQRRQEVAHERQRGVEVDREVVLDVRVAELPP
jgi:hypothetical protein